ncbi:MAG: aminotransferase class I/II-fold pyridoxal phosphate-dependent enzyme [Deltaproteobacteria bacterium]|nr:aminotransferase class I/II-fold pyridoxal phosphate-dependent enzyme [Deltaproteobacteria bacterium]NIS76598.1 aminotransferase class I/II-fold pyridoxal phosphate-dependent enzyme [Deltaproteobacteria bacterium]
MKLAKRLAMVKPSPTLAITAKAKAMRAEGVDVIGFGAGEPDFDTPAHIKDAAKDALDRGMTKYAPVPGTDDLRDAIAEKLRADNGLEYGRENIIVSCGAKHSIYNIAQALFEDGDEVVIPAPYWVSYPPIAYLAGATPVIVDTDDSSEFKITPGQLRSAINERTKAFVLNSPSNPTGTAYTEAELRALAEVIVEKDIYVISDEIYEKIVYDGFVFTSIGSLGDEIFNKTIVVNGLSKTYSMTGWRIGYTAGPIELVKAMTAIQSQSTSNPTSFCLDASTTALTGPQEVVHMMLAEFDRRRRYIVDRLNSIQGVSCILPKGAFYVFPNFSGIYGKSANGRVIENSTDFGSYLLESVKVAVIPGIGFGNDNCARLSYATSMENIERGLDRIEEACRRLS